MASTLPDLKLLRIFISVVRHQGFANAQRELNLSTSAISTYMSQLEGALGIVLCHRGRGGFSLTSKGELFHQETLRLLAELDGFEQYAAALKGELRGTLNLGVIDSTVGDRALPLAEAIGATARSTRPCTCTCRCPALTSCNWGCRTTAWTWQLARFLHA